jgi:hypothetical protein
MKPVKRRTKKLGKRQAEILKKLRLAANDDAGLILFGEDAAVANSLVKIGLAKHPQYKPTPNRFEATG